jgi:hypothetical protein
LAIVLQVSGKAQQQDGFAQRLTLASQRAIIGVITELDLRYV